MLQKYGALTLRGILINNVKLIKHCSEVMLVFYLETNKFDQKCFD